MVTYRRYVTSSGSRKRFQSPTCSGDRSRKVRNHRFAGEVGLTSRALARSLRTVQFIACVTISYSLGIRRTSPKTLHVRRRPVVAEEVLIAGSPWTKCWGFGDTTRSHQMRFESGPQ